MVDIKSLTKAELESEFANKGLPKFRAGQVYDWMHVKLAENYDAMTNVSKSLKAGLMEKCDYPHLELVQLQVSKEDGTKKYLFKKIY